MVRRFDRAVQTAPRLSSPGRRIPRERKTIAAMLAIYCRDHHGQHDALCGACVRLLGYARRRLEVCPFQEDKPACNACQVHCYSPLMRERVKAVMRYAGPRMMFRHPVLSLYHLLDRWRRPLPLTDRLCDDRYQASTTIPRAEGSVPGHRCITRSDPPVRARDRSSGCR